MIFKLSNKITNNQLDEIGIPLMYVEFLRTNNFKKINSFPTGYSAFESVSEYEIDGYTFNKLTFDIPNEWMIN